MEINQTGERCNIEGTYTSQSIENSVIYMGLSICDEGIPNILFKIKDFLKNEYVEVEIPRNKVAPKFIAEIICQHNGICKNIKGVCKSLIMSFEQELATGNIMVKNKHTNLGFAEKGKYGIVFLGQNAVSKDGKYLSEYFGKKDVAPNGSIDDFVEMIKSQILNQKEWCKLEAVLAASAGATVLAYANIAWEENKNNLIWHMLGGSTAGKSTALKLYVSLGSNPEKKRGLAMSYSSTEGALIRRIGDNNGLPVAIDEISAGGNRRKYEEFVYTIGNGEEKDRLGAGGKELQNSSTFNTVVLSNGEVSLLRKCSKNEGVRARCIEFANVNWTLSKEQADSISNCLKHNYALVTPKVAEELIKNDESWRKRWQYWKKTVAERIQKDNITISIGGRVADYVALFALSSEILNKVLNINLNVNEIFEFCYLYIVIANEDEASICKHAYASILEYIAINGEKFTNMDVCGAGRGMYDNLYLDKDQDGFYVTNAHKKVIDGKTYHSYYAFRREAFDSMIYRAGFSDVKVVLHKLKEAGYLKTNSKNHYHSSFTINGVNVNCVTIYYRDETSSGCSLDDALSEVSDMIKFEY
jgi:hypothetical protein